MTYAEFSGDSDGEYACADLQSVDRGVDEQLVEEEEENRWDTWEECVGGVSFTTQLSIYVKMSV